MFSYGAVVKSYTPLLSCSGVGKQFARVSRRYECKFVYFAFPSMLPGVLSMFQLGRSVGSDCAGRFCMPHHSPCGPSSEQHALHMQHWPDAQPLDHRSQSFPLDMRGASHLSVDSAHWPTHKAPQLEASKHATADSQRTDASSWRQNLQETGSMDSTDSRSSETTSSKKQQTVLVWDLDETLILFHSLLSGAYASAHSPQVCSHDFVGVMHWLPAIHQSRNHGTSYLCTDAIFEFA